MSYNRESFELIHTQFNLNDAVIDSSSIIYLQKIDCLCLLTPLLKLYTVKKVIEEIGFQPKGIIIAKLQNNEISTDTLLLNYADKERFALISEDRLLLRRAEKKSLPFFNSLMMLNYMYFKAAISSDEYMRFLDKLHSVARYSQKVWDFGLVVFEKIKIYNQVLS